MLFVSVVSQHQLYLILFLDRGGFAIHARLPLFLVKLLKVLNIVDVVRDLGAPARDANLVAGDARFLLLLGPRAVVRVRVGGRVAADLDCRGSMSLALTRQGFCTHL